MLFSSVTCRGSYSCVSELDTVAVVAGSVGRLSVVIIMIIIWAECELKTNLCIFLSLAGKFQFLWILVLKDDGGEYSRYFHWLR